MRIHNYALKSGISRTPEFERKKLASYAVNCGIKCGHNCLYCSSGTMLRMHPGFKKYGENPFGFGYAIGDPSTPDRVLLGLSITAVPDQSDLIRIIEPNTPSIQKRMLAMREAASRGFRTYAMFCPILPGIANSPEQINELIKFAVECRVEEIFIESVNPRGPGLRQCQEALDFRGYHQEAKAIDRIRHRNHWSKYVINLLQNVQRSVRKYSDIKKLRFLLYPSRLLSIDAETIHKDPEGVIYFGKQ